MNIIEVAADETAVNIEIQFWYNKEIGPQGVKNTTKPAPGGEKFETAIWLNHPITASSADVLRRINFPAKISFFRSSIE